jgi:hypothetical protein
VNEEIFGGLKVAIERGESLKKAMMTFYNAGYKKEEIEEAAQYLSQVPVAVQSSAPQISAIAKPKYSFFGFKKKEPLQKNIPQNQILQSMPIPSPNSLVPQMQSSVPTTMNDSPSKQIVSNYGEMPVQPKPQIIPQQGKKVSDYGTDDAKDKVVIIALTTILVLLFGLLILIFLFKDSIINFFSNVFS